MLESDSSEVISTRRHPIFSRRNLIVFLLILTFLVVAYWPLLRGEFVFNDDSMIWEMEGSWITHPQFFYLLSIGRISTSFLSFPIWSYPEMVGDLKFLRFLNILTLSVAAFLFCSWLQKRSIDLIPSALLTIVTFSLPCFQTQVVVVSAFPSIIGLVAAICAGGLAYHGVFLIGEDWQTALNRYTFASMALLMVSLTTYTSNAMFYWVIIGIPLLQLTSWNRAQALKYCYLFSLPLVTSGIYFLYAKAMNVLVHSLVYIRPEIVGSHEVRLSYDPYIIYSLFVRAMHASGNLWWLLPSSRVVWSVGFVIAAGILIALIAEVRKVQPMEAARSPLHQVVSTNLPKGLLLAYLFPLAVLPPLVSDYGAIGHRMLPALSALIVVILFFAITKISSLLPPRIRVAAPTAVLLGFSVIAITQAQANLENQYVVPGTAEMGLLTVAFKQAELSDIQKIHIIRPFISNVLHSRHRLATMSDEFGLLTSAFPQNIRGLIRSALQEAGLSSEESRRFDISSAYGLENLPQDDHTLIVDMNGLFSPFPESLRK